MRPAVFLVASLCAFAQSPPQSKAPAQPLPFSHKTHVATGLKCAECHPNPDPGDHMTLPATDRCMACHATIAKDKPAIQKLAEFAKSKEPIPWARVYKVPAEVYWDHRSHLKAGMQCEACHGEVAQMDAVAKVTNVTTMAGCLECHRNNNAGTGCGFCHEEK
ncbi:MAG TPA: cytochrome c3 family protein [Bryobacteraceae bacterium]|nr:cytochrome c3 family protein [Bryobacteraceae bacterium]